MDINEQKAALFVKRLLQNPALAQLPALQKEEQILNFLKINSGQLLPTLASPGFFPQQSWPQIFSFLYKALMSIINQPLYTQINEGLNNVDFSFISFIREQNFPSEKCKDIIYEYLTATLQKYEARRAFSGPFMAVQMGFIDKYIENIFLRKQYIHFELIKVQRLKMGKKEVKNFIKASLFLRVAIYQLAMDDPNEIVGSNSGTVQKTYAEKVLQKLMDQLKLLPPELLQSAINSNISFLEHNSMEATARISAILGARCKNYKPITKLDRGADYPDKSWFNIARKNYKYYGFDIKMLDEFYRIAAENGW